MAEQGVGSHSRYCLLKAYAAAAREEYGLEALWFAKHLEAAAADGTALAVGYPHIAALVAAHYTTVEDLTGATVGELVANVDLNRVQAAAVLAALPE